MTTPTPADIGAARDRIRDHLPVTPVMTSATLADRVGAAVFGLKCESFQKTGSFKVRGALNAVMQLDAGARSRGVVTVSAGNHAQALAWAARSAGVRCTVVMPATASESKAAASAGYGAEVVRHGTGAEAFARAHALAEEHGYALVHPFDDVSVLTGAATVGSEMLEQMADADVIVVPIGGGGLIAGIACAVKQARPNVRVYGVEPEGAATMRMSMDQGSPARLSAPPKTIADGLAAPFAGVMCYPLVQQFVDDVVLVSDDEITSALSFMLMRTKLLAEPAGAASTAALLNGRIPNVAGKKVVAVLSGGNVDLEKLKGLL